MAVAHLDLLDVHDAAPRRIGRRLAVVLGGILAIALAAIPGAFAVVLLLRPDLFLSP
jgi:hypothetical protein